jgi:hypothetical protein
MAPAGRSEASPNTIELSWIPAANRQRPKKRRDDCAGSTDPSQFFNTLSLKLITHGQSLRLFKKFLFQGAYVRPQVPDAEGTRIPCKADAAFVTKRDFKMSELALVQLNSGD